MVERRVGGLNPDEVKAALKDGIKEWLDDKFAMFGKWSLMTIMAMILASLTYFILIMNGWHRPG